MNKTPDQIIDEIFERHGHIFDGLKWSDDLKENPNAPMPQGLQDYFKKVLNS